MTMKSRSAQRSSRALRPRLLAVAVASCFAIHTAWALPTGAQVVAGSASIQQSGNVLSVTNTPGTILNWQAFSVAPLETARFLQQNSLSAVLNRVTGPNASAILGALQSNGKVYLLNPNGILFGAGAQVDVQGLVASTLRMSDQDFLAGRLTFTAGNGAGDVRNEGIIRAGGNVYFVAPNIENSGIIRSSRGEVLLAAGREVNLVDGAHPDIQVVVSAPGDKAVNLGEIAAGRISVFGSLVQQKGIASADTVEVDEKGRIVFRASQQLNVDAGSRTTANGAAGGTVTLQSAGDSYVSGTVEAIGGQGTGGTISALGNRVAVTDNALLDASGEAGGGRILVGGDYQGNNPAVQNATVTWFGPDATLRADATKVGAGGTVIVWADDTTRAFGGISARGGVDGGNGGFVETSGHYLETTGIRLDIGQGGTWLLDPYNITIGAADITNTSSGTDPITYTGTASNSAVAASAINTVLNTGTSVIVDTAGAGSDAGDITVSAGISKAEGADASLTLRAARNITVGAVAISSTSGKLNVTLQADADGVGGGAITLQAGSSIVSYGGNIMLGGGPDPATGFAIGVPGVSNGAGISITQSTLDAGAGNLTLRGKGATGVTDGYPDGIQIGDASGATTVLSGANISILGYGGTTSGTAATNQTAEGIWISESGTGVITLSATQGMSLAGYGGSASYGGVLASDLTDAHGININGASLSAGTTLSLWGEGGISSRNYESGVVLNGASLTANGASLNLMGKEGLGSYPYGAGIWLVGGNTLDADATSAGVVNLKGSSVVVGNSGPNVLYGGATGGVRIETDWLETAAESPAVYYGGWIEIVPASARPITLNGDAPVYGNELNIDASTMVSLANSPAGIIRIGDTVNTGTLTVSGVSNFGATKTVHLRSTGAITQASSSAVFTAGGLAVTSLGDVGLNTAANSVATLAGSVNGSGTEHFYYHGAGDFIVGTVDGVSGIGIANFPNYTAGSTSGVIGLLSNAGGNITQTSSGILGGAAVWASTSAGFINLSTVANPTGIIAGSASDYFSYRSANPIKVASVTVGGSSYAGITAPNRISLESTSSISQDAGANLLTATYGSFLAGTIVSLGNTGNSLVNIAGNAYGGFTYAGGSFTAGKSIAGGVTDVIGATDTLNLESSGTLTVYGGLTGATGVNILATGVDFGATSTLTATNGNISIFTNGLTIGSRPITASGTGGGVHIAPKTVGSIEVTTYGGTCTSSPMLCIADSLGTIVTPQLSLGHEGTGSGIGPLGEVLPITTNIVVNAPINRGAGNLYLLGSGNVSQNITTGTLAAGLLGVHTGGSIQLQNSANTVAAVVMGAGSDIALKTASSTGLTIASIIPFDEANTYSGVKSTTGSVTLNASAGGIAVTHPILASTGVYLTSYGNIVGGSITAGSTLQVTSTNGGIGEFGVPLLTSVDMIGIAYGSGIINILNGKGLLIPGNNTFQSLSGNIYLVALGPLTVDGYIQAPAGNISLTALNDNALTLNSGSSLLVNTSGMVALAGGTVSSNGTINVTPTITQTYIPPPPPPPTVDACIANPALAGCTAVLPPLADCTANPALPGCSAVLPPIAICTAAPETPGCSAVLPPLADCTANPALPGCSAVLPPIAICTAAPETPGCSAVLPPLADCTANPALPGCSAVLPPLADCATTPTLPGCSAVLPPIAICLTTPTAPGCSAVLPPIAVCTTAPATPGCSVV
ncbi:MAG: filamentous hemagglutinin N-terminal domain-containing protein, partial [Sulfurisoma sp.]|nr:filamentous hemagglutinin N-terminal domain-containing protein [Sulfurisoma sp.]